jgi:hypothetical protein
MELNAAFNNIAVILWRSVLLVEDTGGPGEEEFEDTKGVIRIRISKKNRQHNGQKKKYKRTNNDLQNIHTRWRKPEDPKKTTDLSQVTDKL